MKSPDVESGMGKNISHLQSGCSRLPVLSAAWSSPGQWLECPQNPAVRWDQEKCRTPCSWGGQRPRVRLSLQPWDYRTQAQPGGCQGSRGMCWSFVSLPSSQRAVSEVQAPVTLGGAPALLQPPEVFVGAAGAESIPPWLGDPS